MCPFCLFCIGDGLDHLKISDLITNTEYMSFKLGIGVIQMFLILEAEKMAGKGRSESSVDC